MKIFHDLRLRSLPRTSIALVAAGMLGLFGLTGCEDDPIEDAGDNIEEGVDETGDAIEDAADETGR